MEKNTKGLTISYWDANGIKDKKHEILQFLRDHDVDIMLIGETWLRNGDKFKIPNYTMYLSNRPHQSTKMRDSHLYQK